MIVTLFDTIGGHRAYNVRNSIPGIVDVDYDENFESQPILDQATFVMPRLSQGVVVISRYLQRSAVITWIGLYRPLPNHLNRRSGDYFGSGIFIVNSTISGPFVIKILDRLLDQVERGMRRYQLDTWNDRAAYDEALDKSPDLKRLADELEVRHSLRGLNPSSSETCAANPEEIKQDLGHLAEHAQSDDAFRKYRRLFIFRDEAALDALAKGSMSWFRPDRDGSAPGESVRAQQVPISDRSPQPRLDWSSQNAPPRGRSYEARSEDDQAYVDAPRKPWMSRGTLSVILGLLNTAALAGLFGALYLGAFAPREPDLAVKSDPPHKPELVEEGLRTNDAKAEDTPPKPLSDVSPILSEAQIKSLREIVEAIGADNCSQKPSCVKRQVDMARDIFRQPTNPNAGKPGSAAKSN